MNLILKKRKTQSTKNKDKLKDLQEACRMEKNKLINEQIRGELITWEQDFSYLNRIINSNVDDKEWRVRTATEDCIDDITFCYSGGDYYPEFCSGMREMERRVKEKLISISPFFMRNPTENLQQLAYDGRINEIISYIETLEYAFMQND